MADEETCISRELFGLARCGGCNDLEACIHDPFTVELAECLWIFANELEKGEDEE